MAVSEKRMDPGDQLSTNTGYLTDGSEIEWNTISSDSKAPTESELEDTAISRQPFSTAGSPDDSPSHPGQAGNPSSSHSVSTDNPPAQSPQPAPDPPPPSSPQPSKDNSPPSSPQPAPDNSHPPPSNPGPSNPGPSTGPHRLTDDHSPPSMEPQHPGTPMLENFFNELSEIMKGKFKRSFSGYGNKHSNPPLLNCYGS